MKLASQHVCNTYANHPYRLGELDLQLVTATVRNQLGILTLNLDVVGVHAFIQTTLPHASLHSFYMIACGLNTSYQHKGTVVSSDCLFYEGRVSLRVMVLLIKLQSPFTA